MPNDPVPPAVKTEILNYFSNSSLAYSVKRKPQEWATVQKDLVTLQAMPTRDADKLFETYSDDDTDN